MREMRSEESSNTVPDIAVLADDLSGAAEVASTFLGRAARVDRLRLDTEPADRHGVVIADLEHPHDDAARRGAHCPRPRSAEVPAGTTRR